MNLRQPRKAWPENAEIVLIGIGNDFEQNLVDVTSSFVFSTWPKHKTLGLLKVIACDNAKIGTFNKVVINRDETEHPGANREGNWIVLVTK